MHKTVLKFKKIEVKAFKPKDLKVNLSIYFDKDEKEEIIDKEFILKNPIEIVNKILLAIKSKGKIIVEEEDDDILKNIYITRVDREEEIEDKLLVFFKDLVERGKKLKSLKNAGQYMKLYNEIKVMKLVF